MRTCPELPCEISGSANDAWFCLTTHPRQEHIAASNLRQDSEIQVFLPRIRFKRSTRCGPAWVTEALFPNYIFARFDLENRLRRIRHARGVRDVVHFGSLWPAIPDDVIAELRKTAADDETLIVPDDFQNGEPVEISGGPFHGLKAVVSRVIPGRQRVAVLLEFLGRQTAVEVMGEHLVRDTDLALQQAGLNSGQQ